MLIQEEYARRHAFPMSLAGHTLREGLVFLRGQSNHRLIGNVSHMIMRVKWVPHDRHPGTYQLILQRPAHDSHSGRSHFNLIQDPITLSYEEFESAIGNLRKTSLSSYVAILESRAASLFLWETFVCSFDGWIVRNGSTKFMLHVEASIDPHLPVETRYDQFDAALNLMGHENPSVFEKWQTHFASQKKTLLPWLGKLFNGD